MHPTARVEAYRAERDLASVWLCRPASVAWIGEGADVTVDRTAEVGVAAVGIDDDGPTVLTSNNEADRLAAEVFPETFPIESVPWYEGTLTEAVRGYATRPAAADIGLEGLMTIDPASLRVPLHDGAIDRYRSLGRETATVLESTLRDAAPGDTERGVAGDLHRGLGRRGITATVVLVGGGTRASAYRHPTPTETPLGRYVIAAVTARRDGLHASCTRTVAFDPPGWLRARHAVARRVETAAIAATHAAGTGDGTAGDVLDRLRDAYRDAGWPDEWRRHHQGGAAGYAGREWVLHPGIDRRVELPMAFAYNPTVEGAKSEDTVLVTEAGCEVLTATGEWPGDPVTAGGLTLDRPSVLER